MMRTREVVSGLSSLIWVQIYEEILIIRIFVPISSRKVTGYCQFFSQTRDSSVNGGLP